MSLLAVVVTLLAVTSAAPPPPETPLDAPNEGSTQATSEASTEATAPAPTSALEAGAASSSGAPPPVAPVPPAARVEPDGAAASRPVVRVTLRDGQVVTGRLVERRADGAVRLELSSGTLLTLDGAAVAAVREESRASRAPTAEAWFLDPNRTRYLYGPSAMMLRRNEVSVGQLELLATTASFGVTDFLSVQAGTAVPLLFASPPESLHALFAVKVGGPVSERLFLAAGTQALWLPFLRSLPPRGVPLLGLVFGTATYGLWDAHVSVSAGVPVNLLGGPENLQAWLGNVIIAVSGNYRLARSLALVSENWLMVQTASPGGFLLLDALAVRILGERLAVDVGLVLATNQDGLAVPIPIPWLAFTYNFF